MRRDKGEVADMYKKMTQSKRAYKRLFSRKVNPNSIKITRRTRRQKGSAIINALCMAIVISLLMLAMCGFAISTLQSISKDRVKAVSRAACEASLEWALQQLNTAMLANTTSSLDCTTYNGTPVVTTVPSSVLSDISGSTAVTATITVANVQPSSNSYLYDNNLLYSSFNPEQPPSYSTLISYIAHGFMPPAEAATTSTTTGNGLTQNYWRVVTSTAKVGSYKKSIRVVLKPALTETQQSSTVQTTNTITLPYYTLAANTISFSGSGLITGSVHSNGNMTLGGSNNITGGVTTTGNFSITGSGTITGNVTSLGNISLMANVKGNVTTPGAVTTAGSTSVTGTLSAGKNVTLSASTTISGDLLTAGSLTTSGSFTQNNTGLGRTAVLVAEGGQNASGGSFSINNTNLYSGGSINTAWASVNSGQAYYTTTNNSPAYSSGASNGANINTSATAQSTYATGVSQLNTNLASAATAAAAVTYPPAPDPPAGAHQLSPSFFSGSSNVTLAPGDYVVTGPLTMSGANSITVTGDGSVPVRLWVQGGTGSQPAISMAGSNQITLPTSGGQPNPKSFQVYTNSSGAINFSGSTNVAFGYLYAPNSAVSFSGSNNVKVGGMVANSITASGASPLTQIGDGSSPWTYTSTSPATTTVQTPVYTFSHWRAVSYQEF